MIHPVYRYHPHRNYGTHPERGLSSNAIWKRHWWYIENLAVMWHDAPLGRVGRHFVEQLMEELKEVWTRD